MKHIFTLIILWIIAANAILAQAPTTGLVAYFPMDGDFTNSNAITTTSYGTITPVTSSAGFANAAMHFGNTSTTATVVPNYVTTAITSAVNFAATADFTISTNFRITSTPLSNGAFGLFDNNLNYGGYGLWALRSGSVPTGAIQLNFHFKGNYVSTSTSTVINLNTWYNVTGTRNGTIMSIYLNGVLQNTSTTASTTPTYTYNPRIGSMFFNGQTPPQYNGFNGAMEELRIYNRALSAVEVATLSAVSLPVKLSNFTAALQNKNTLLNWQTAQEQNSKHFELERSTNGTLFNTVATIAASGNSSTLKNYAYTDVLSDAILLNKTVYYRIKMVDLDNSFSYTKTIPIHLTKASIAITISPNPIKNVAQLQLANFEKGGYTMDIIDAKGVLVKRWTQQLTQAIQVFSIDVSILQSGNYILKVYNQVMQKVIPFTKSN